MIRGDHRFTVDREGGITDRDATGERAAAEFNREMEQRRRDGYRPTPEEQEKFLRVVSYEQSEFAIKFGGSLFAVGLITFGYGSSSDGWFGWWTWIILGSVLTVVGALFAISGSYDYLRGPGD